MSGRVSDEQLEADLAEAEAEVVAVTYSEAWGDHANQIHRRALALRELQEAREALERFEGLERYAAEHGIPALLDHLGLDGLGNEVNALVAERDEAREALRAYADAKNWAVARDDLRNPSCIWIGPGAEEKPIPAGPKVAREALGGGS